MSPNRIHHRRRRGRERPRHDRLRCGAARPRPTRASTEADGPVTARMTTGRLTGTRGSARGRDARWPPRHRDGRRQRSVRALDPPLRIAPHGTAGARREEPADRREGAREHRHARQAAQPGPFLFTDVAQTGLLDVLCACRAHTIRAAHPVNGAGLSEELILAVEPVHLTPSPAQQGSHARANPRMCNPRANVANACTRAAGSRVGDNPGLRPLARRWGSPNRRPFHRRPASQGTCL